MQFITGNKFKKICDYIIDEHGFNQGFKTNDIPIYFIKTDFLNDFINLYKPNHLYKIITHNSDYPINNNFLELLNDKNLVHWFGQNIEINHNKMTSIPIGIANEIWKHGDETLLTDIINLNNKKNTLIYSNFDVNTNYIERIKCINMMNKYGLKLNKRVDFKTYLSELSQSFFSLSPNGNGIDCHKTWESFYLKTIPIVTNSKNISFYDDYPVLIIDNWDDFDINILNEELYREIIKKHDEQKITIKYFYNKILKT